MLARLILALTFLALVPLRVTAQSLLYDFETDPSGDVNSSSPRSFTETNGVAVFSAYSQSAGRELWVTDGTAAGTVLLADISVGLADSSPSDFAGLPNGLVLFVANAPGLGRELYVTDGTPSGTALLLDISTGGSSSTPTALTVVGSTVFFFADVPGLGIELWTSDGTTAGTALVVDAFGGSLGLVNNLADADMAQLGSGEVVFPVKTIGWELWKSDGTAIGTTPVVSLPSSFSSPAPDEWTTLGAQVLMRVSQGSNHFAWVTDGTLPGTSSLAVSATSGFKSVGSLGYFRHNDAALGEELWVTDGTPLGTSLLVDPTPTVGVSSVPQWIGELSGELLFAADDDLGSRMLFKTDGTTIGTNVISDLAPAIAPTELESVLHLGELWFATPDSGGSVAKSDGTLTGTVIVGQAKLANGFASVGAAVVYSANSTPAGTEVWSSPAMAGATGLVLDITPPPLSGGSNPQLMGEFRNETYFAVRPTGSTDDELWATDGTPAGTRLVAGTGAPQFPQAKPVFARNEERFMFIANDAALGIEPHSSDGTAAGTSALDLQPGASGSNGYAVVTLNGSFVMTASVSNGHELYVTDGTLVGTSLLADIWPGATSSNPDDFLIHGSGSGELLFFSAQDDSHGREPWVTDGTGTGTQPLGDLRAGPEGQTSIEFAGLPSVVLFTADDGVNGRELWSTDGTFAGTQLLADMIIGPQSSEPRDLRVFGDRVFFTVSIGGSDNLWTSDGTQLGTLPFTGFPLAVRSPLIPVDEDRAVIWLGDGVSDELWSIDAALFQPQLVRAFDLNNVAIQSYELAHIGANRVVFAADDGVDGEALWSTNGTAAGTSQIANFPLGNGDPRAMSRAGQQIVFRADDGLNGVELYRVPLIDSGAWVGETYGYGFPGTGGVIPRLSVAGSASSSSAAPFEIRVTGAFPASTAFLAWSRDDGMALLPGGLLWLGGALNFELLLTDPNGDATFAFNPGPALVGQRFDAQWFVLDPLGPVFGVASATCAVEVQIGL